VILTYDSHRTPKQHSNLNQAGKSPVTDIMKADDVRRSVHDITHGGLANLEDIPPGGINASSKNINSDLHLVRSVKIKVKGVGGSQYKDYIVNRERSEKACQSSLRVLFAPLACSVNLHQKGAAIAAKLTEFLEDCIDQVFPMVPRRDGRTKEDSWGKTDELISIAYSFDDVEFKFAKRYNSMLSGVLSALLHVVSIVNECHARDTDSDDDASSEGEEKEADSDDDLDDDHYDVHSAAMKYISTRGSSSVDRLSTSSAQAVATSLKKNFVCQNKREAKKILEEARDADQDKKNKKKGSKNKRRNITVCYSDSSIAKMVTVLCGKNGDAKMKRSVERALRQFTFKNWMMSVSAALLFTTTSTPLVVHVPENKSAVRDLRYVLEEYDLTKAFESNTRFWAPSEASPKKYRYRHRLRRGGGGGGGGGEQCALGSDDDDNDE